MKSAPRRCLLRAFFALPSPLSKATPDPKWVVAAGDCAAHGGIFAGSYAVEGGVSKVIPVDLHISACPPDPMTLLKGLLSLIQCA